MNFNDKTREHRFAELFSNVHLKFKYNLRVFLYRVPRDWSVFIKKDKGRTLSSSSLSIVIHTVLIIGYFGLAKLDVPLEPPIREISFIDMTEENSRTTKPKKSSQKTQKQLIIQPEPQPELAGNTTEKKSEISKLFGEDRLFLDSKRKQVPIKVIGFETVADNKLTTENLLKISPAKGLKNDDRVARPIKINLNKNKNLVLKSHVLQKSNSVALEKRSPDFDIKRDVLYGPATISSLEIKSVPAQIELNKTDVKIKSARTFITGALANRAILKKLIPPFPLWARKQGVGATISLRFTVMEDGNVKENIIIERTSGSGDWDRMVVEVLKQWEFVSLTKSDVRHDQTGLITFQFVI